MRPSSAVAIAEAIDNSTDFAGRIHADAFGKQVKRGMPELVEVSGNVLLAQLVRFMTLPLLHAAGPVLWAGSVATASQRRANPWAVVVVGIVSWRPCTVFTMCFRTDFSASGLQRHRCLYLWAIWHMDRMAIF